MTNVDLKDAYFMVPIQDRAFLKFSFKERAYQFKCLPFGLACMCTMGLHQDPEATCCSVETTGNGIDCLHRRHPHPGRVHQGAGSGTCYRPDIPIRETIYIGFLINKPKSILEPTQSIEFLRFSVNSVQQELSLPAGKVKKIRAETRHLLEGNQITAKKLSQLLGRLQAATRAVSLAPLFYHKIQRALQRTLEQSDQDYSAQLILSTGE